MGVQCKYGFLTFFLQTFCTVSFKHSESYMSTGVRKSSAAQVATHAMVFIAIEHWSIKMRKRGRRKLKKNLYIKGLRIEYELKEKKIE